MSRLNAAASEAMVEVGAAAATDVTGFGLVGHLLEMLGGRASARLDYAAVPLLDDAVALAAEGLVPAGTKRNRDAMHDLVDARGLDGAHEIVLFDAQTSGGLLIAVEAGKTSALLDALAARGVADARRIGAIVDGHGRIEVD
jgi:selenide,water dikinase